MTNSYRALADSIMAEVFAEREDAIINIAFSTEAIAMIVQALLYADTNKLKEFTVEDLHRIFLEKEANRV